MAAKKQSFETDLARLEEIVKSLEKGEVSLSDSMKLFEEGSALLRRCGDALDEADPISEGYYLEVSSPGIERQLKRQKDFERFYGENISVKLFRAVNGTKQLTAKLVSRTEEKLTVETDAGEVIEIDNKDVAVVRLAIEF